MTSEVYSETYADSGEPVRVGDLVWLDGHAARILEVCLPASSVAAAYGCAPTGGIVVLFEGGQHDGVKVLERFGLYGHLRKRAGEG